MKQLLPPIVLATAGTISIATGLWFIYRPIAPIFVGVILIALAVGLATSSAAPNQKTK